MYCMYMTAQRICFSFLSTCHSPKNKRVEKGFVSENAKLFKLVDFRCCVFYTNVFGQVDVAYSGSSGYPHLSLGIPRIIFSLVMRFRFGFGFEDSLCFPVLYPNFEGRLVTDYYPQVSCSTLIKGGKARSRLGLTRRASKLAISFCDGIFTGFRVQNKWTLHPEKRTCGEPKTAVSLFGMLFCGRKKTAKTWARSSSHPVVNFRMWSVA